MVKGFLCSSVLLLSVGLTTRAGAVAGKPVDQVVHDYVQAIGGMAAIERIETRETHAQRHHSKLTYLWQKPNKVLLVEGKKKLAYDGGSGWMLSSKKHVTKLSKGSEQPLETDANPIRYAHLRQLYSEVNPAPPETVEERKMDVVVAPNDLGATKLYFDATTHLLARVDETGVTSAYFRHVTDFLDYKDQDGVKLPFRIVHHSTEPGVGTEEVRISKVMQNVPIKADVFQRPAGSSVTLGGKR